MSSRRTTCRLPSASISSTEVFVSEASSPLITRPSVVATVYWTKLPSTLRLGSRMWIKSSSRGMAAMPGEVGADLAALRRRGGGTWRTAAGRPACRGGDLRLP